ncbi:hypothetical protein Ddc_07319 [Ditylenchus destructor]|nr:hypothetical protein Ddc_07319 [Ditylenchus destructor]
MEFAQSLDQLVAELVKCRNELTETRKSLTEKNSQLKDSKNKFSQAKALAIKYRDLCAQHEKTIESFQFNLKRQREESISSAINATNGSGTSSFVQTVNSGSSGLEQAILENQMLSEGMKSLRNEMTAKDEKFRTLELRLGNALAGYHKSAKRSRKTNKIVISSNSLLNYEHCECISNVSSCMQSSQVTHAKSSCHRSNSQENVVRTTESDNDSNANSMTEEFCIDESLKRGHELTASLEPHDSRTLNEEPAFKIASTESFLPASVSTSNNSNIFGGVYKSFEFIAKPFFIIGNSSSGCKESSFGSFRKEIDLQNKNSTNTKSSMFGGSKVPEITSNFPWHTNNATDINPTSNRDNTPFASFQFSSPKSPKRHPAEPVDKASSSCTEKDSFQINATKSAHFPTKNVSNSTFSTPPLTDKLSQSTPFSSIKPQTSIFDATFSKSDALACSISHKTKAIESAPTTTNMPIFGGTKLIDTSFAALAKSSAKFNFSTSGWATSFGDPKNCQLFSQKNASPEKSSIECKFLEAVVKSNDEVSNDVVSTSSLSPEPSCSKIYSDIENELQMFSVDSTLMEDTAHESIKHDNSAIQRRKRSKNRWSNSNF